MLKIVATSGLTIIGNLEGTLLKDPRVLTPTQEGKVAFVEMPCNPKELTLHPWGIEWDPNDDFKNTYIRATTGIDLSASKIIKSS